MLNQLNLDGRTKIEESIARLRMFEPPMGYHLGFSGGKDSEVIYDLAIESGVKFDAHYQMSGIDPPELFQFIKQYYPEVERHKPPKSIWKMAAERGLPIRQGRWCCEAIKETGGDNRVVMTGIRSAESSRRKRRQVVEECYKNKNKIYVNPIIDWSTDEVWEYINTKGLSYCSLYDEGFTRLGCVLCPMTTVDKVQVEIERWPKIADAWRRAAIRYWEKGTEGAKRFESGDAFFEWWISRESSKKKLVQQMVFD